MEIGLILMIHYSMIDFNLFDYSWHGQNREPGIQIQNEYKFIPLLPLNENLNY